MTTYGVMINFKRGGQRVIELPRPYDFQKSTPVFEFSSGDGSGSSRLVTAGEIRANWNAWSGDWFTDTVQYPHLTVAEAEERGIEIL